MGSNSRYKVCLCFTRKFKAGELEVPEDVKKAFRNYSGGEAHMTGDQLRRFVKEELREADDVADSLVEKVLRQHRQHHLHFHHHTRSRITLDDFFHFLFSVHLNPPLNPQVHEDMKAPLSHYLIYTGHNSYLTGNQLSSDSSEIPIIRALERGVRAIELDLWPTSTKDDVHVLHGRTLTTPVDLIKCLQSISKHAFSTSPYPVILTLEDHLTPDLQAKVAQMITETFKDVLFYPDSECLKELPSPEDLKYKIIISTRPPKEELKQEKDPSNDDEESNQEVVVLEQIGLQESEEILVDKQVQEHSDDLSISSNAAPVYKRLISIPTVPRHKLKEVLKGDPKKVTRLSLSEELLEKSTVCYGKDLVRFTDRNILRIFPKTTRFDSSNYNPFVGWTHGAQMVAFNMQGHGKYLWWMQGLFRANGGCGYVKKPEFLINLDPDDDKVFDPKEKMPVKTTLKVKLYMGDGWHLDFKKTHFDAYSPPDFYTKIGIEGVKGDKIMKKTKVKQDEWNPIWEEEFMFPLSVPELALLRVEVREYNVSEKDNFGGQTCLPVWDLKPGLRAVPLYNHKGQKYSSVKLLMGFHFL